jgi:hypothetical protein
MFNSLDSDDDVLLFNKDTFTVGRFKELVREDFYNKFNLSGTFSDKSFFSMLDTFKNLSVGAVKCQLDELNWSTIIQNYQILRIGSKGWQKGKIRIQICIKFIYPYNLDKFQVFLEFCADEPTEPESPLDDLRQLPEYKNGLSPV